ncbi:YbjN domain-containing protein [Pseudorhodoplanes sp.]|uniref:YbjN domain-containing protein n=1 Tax=Pseudorhodoplanes sp. TaxID=1934341 RepID=UPI002C7D203A|nr:YbjN domain-containing protein [Pseudorhodoplanes sp.]HWV51677.1 YbjN domain-containing protein [Pseudorhodoplanes sp.]
MTLETLRAMIQGSGYRAEVVTDGNISFLRSASNGLDFDLRPGNVLVKEPGAVGEKPDRLADFVFVVLFTVQGAFPVDLLNRWNQTHRFGRLFLDKTNPERQFLVMTLDVSVAGGVTSASLRHQLAIWDSLVQQLVPWLREELGKIASTVDTQKTASSDQVQQIQPANA